VLKCFDFTIKLPKLHIVTIHELFDAFFGRVVILADDVNGAQKMAVVVDDVRAVLLHWLAPPSKNTLQHPKCHLTRFTSWKPRARYFGGPGPEEFTHSSMSDACLPAHSFEHNIHCSLVYTIRIMRRALFRVK
jgi:hypothetical protein